MVLQRRRGLTHHNVVFSFSQYVILRLIFMSFARSGYAEYAIEKELSEDEQKALIKAMGEAFFEFDIFDDEDDSDSN